jgi:glyoxylase-like metal-dependent hydrolase (beta-lactamase superfamily II)
VEEMMESIEHHINSNRGQYQRFKLFDRCAAAVNGIFDFRKHIFRQAVPTDFFERELDKGDLFIKLADRIYQFKHGFNRALVVDTGAGLLVIDTFSSELTKRLKHQLRDKFGTDAVRWVIYSHHHLDHVRGAAVLEPNEVIAHESLWQFVTDFPAINDVLQPTRTVSGDQHLILGQVEVQMLLMPNSHSQNLYAFHFPRQRLLLAPDLLFIKAFPPFGLPDWYYPGYIRALDRLIALDFDIAVPSHADAGTKEDLIEFRQMMVDFREAVRSQLIALGGEAANGKTIRKIYDKAYPELKRKYGHWHGFNAMFVPHFFGQVGGEYLGY